MVSGPASDRPEEADLAGVDELGHRAHRLLDRDVGIDAVLVVEVDVVDAQPAQRGVAGPDHVVRAAVDPARGRVLGVAHDPELGGQHHLVAPVGDGLAHQLLVGVRAVDVGGVQERHPEVEGLADGGDRLGLVALP